jgi:hypothetical protein
MGWDQALTSHPQSPSSTPASRPRVDRPNPDSEWDRWSFLVAPDRLRFSNTTASRRWNGNMGCWTVFPSWSTYWNVCIRFYCTEATELRTKHHRTLRLLSAYLYPPLICGWYPVLAVYCDANLKHMWSNVLNGTELFSSACYILTILHPCVVAQARHISTTKRM